jgi:hypothetical protein
MIVTLRRSNFLFQDNYLLRISASFAAKFANVNGPYGPPKKFYNISHLGQSYNHVWQQLSPSSLVP